MSSADGWSGLLRTLASSFSELTKAEIAAVKRDLQGSSRHLTWGLAWIVAGLSFLFWGLAVLTWAAVEGVALVWPRWLAALSVGSLLLVVFFVLLLLGRARLRRVEAPLRTVKRRAQDHKQWWNERISGGVEVDPSVQRESTISD